MKIDLTIDIHQEVPVSIPIGDIIEALNELPIAQRWNNCAKLIEALDLTEPLHESGLKLVKTWLDRKSQELNRHDTVTDADGVMFQLTSFNNSVVNKRIMSGKVEMYGQNANGFIERILAMGLENYNFTISTCIKGDITLAFEIPGAIKT